MSIMTPSQNAKGGVSRQAALLRSFFDQANGDPQLAAELRSEYFAELGRRSGSRRRAKARERVAALTAELEARAGLRITSVDELAELARHQVKR
jgi:hypothetical protein